MFIKLTEAEFNLRSDIYGAEYARKDRLSCKISSKGLIVTKDEAKIEARITISTQEGCIKDIDSQYKKEKDYYVDLKEPEWENEPDIVWGTGFFVNNELWLDLFCTDKEMTILQTIIFPSDKKGEPIFVSCKVSHPDHIESQKFDIGNSDMNPEYGEDGWHQGFSCIAGWDLSKEAGQVPK
jgi:hypothetical protein